VQGPGVVRCDRRSRAYFFLGAAIIAWDVSGIIMWDVSDIIIILDVSGVEEAGFCSPFEHPAMATTAMTNAMRFMRAPSSNRRVTVRRVRCAA
jgi:hypothetical protein